MSDVALFEIEQEEWVPVWEPTIAGFGWHREPDRDAILHADGTPIDKAERTAFLKAGRCRDCGVTCAMNMGGGRPAGSYRICDGCAQLDGCKLASHTTVIELRKAIPSFPAMEEAAHCLDCGWWLFAKRWPEDGSEWRVYTAEEVIDECAHHETARWRSRWGKQHEQGEHDGLMAGQVKRRVAYLAQLGRVA